MIPVTTDLVSCDPTWVYTIAFTDNTSNSNSMKNGQQKQNKLGMSFKIITFQTRHQAPDSIVPLALTHHRLQKLHYAIRPVYRDLCITCAHNVYSRALSSLEDNLKMARKDRNMQLSSIATKYTLIYTVVFDYIPFPIFTHTNGMTHFKILQLHFSKFRDS